MIPSFPAIFFSTEPSSSVEILLISPSPECTVNEMNLSLSND